MSNNNKKYSIFETFRLIKFNIIKKLSLVFVFAFTAGLVIRIDNCFAQLPAFMWAKQQSAGGSGDDYGTNVATDANGNIILAGSFICPSITF